MLDKLISELSVYLGNVNIINLVLGILLIFPPLMGFLFRSSSRTMEKTIDGFTNTIAMVLSLMAGSFILKSIFISDKYNILNKIKANIPVSLRVLLESKPQIFLGAILVIATIVVYCLLKFIFRFLTGLIFEPIFEAIDDYSKRKRGITSRIIGLICQVPKALCYVIIMCFLLNYVSMLNISKNLNSSLSSSNIYGYVVEKVVIPVSNSNVTKNISNIISDSFKISKVVGNGENASYNVLYNGVTLDQGVRSNEDINSKALSVTSNGNGSYGKAKLLYEWVGNNIEYDDNKAMEIIAGNTKVASGAIEAYSTRSGVCFDYACLYVAMCRANNIRVRLIVGQGFNGKSWVSHSWNQIYDNRAGKWINVDTTFYNGGNYFDNENFNIDHKDSKVAGEWGN